jgi:hypothetical protein
MKKRVVKPLTTLTGIPAAAPPIGDSSDYYQNAVRLADSGCLVGDFD